MGISSKNTISISTPHSSVEWKRNTKEFREFAALLVQFYRDLGDLADLKPIRPTRLMVSDLLDVCEAADGIQDLARRLNPDFKAGRQKDAAEFADFLFTALDACVWIASDPNPPVGQTFFRTLQQVQCECGLYKYIHMYEKAGEW